MQGCCKLRRLLRLFNCQTDSWGMLKLWLSGGLQPHLTASMYWSYIFGPTLTQGVVLTGRNRTGPPCSVGRPTAHAPGGQLARPPAALQTTTTDVSVQNNTGPLGGPVIIKQALFRTNVDYAYCTVVSTCGINSRLAVLIEDIAASDRRTDRSIRIALRCG